MRGEDERSEDLFSFVRLEQRVPADHPLRAIRALVDEALGQPEGGKVVSREHLWGEGRLVEAWASMKGFVPKGAPSDQDPGTSGGGQGRNAERDFHGEKRSNETHASTTDPDARLFRKGKGKEAKLCHMGQISQEKRPGLTVAARL